MLLSGLWHESPARIRWRFPVHDSRRWLPVVVARKWDERCQNCSGVGHEVCQLWAGWGVYTLCLGKKTDVPLSSQKLSIVNGIWHSEVIPPWKHNYIIINTAEYQLSDCCRGNQAEVIHLNLAEVNAALVMSIDSNLADIMLHIIHWIAFLCWIEYIAIAEMPHCFETVSCFRIAFLFKCCRLVSRARLVMRPCC